MDANRFDHLSRQVGRQSDRRRMLKSIAGSALALVGVGAIQRRAGAQSGREGSNCFSTADCETGLICEGVGLSFLGELIASGYGPSYAGDLFGTSPGTCRYRGDDNCAHSGQYCREDADCCNGLNLTCNTNRNECERE
jgi:hypothetical protein